MRERKLVYIVFALLLISGFSASCVYRNVDTASLRSYRENAVKYDYGKANRKITVGFSMASMQEERWQTDRDIFVAKCKELGADVIVQSANSDDKLQIAQCEKLLSQKVDVLVIIPQNSETASVVVEAANAVNVPVVAYDRLIRNCNLDAYITYDNEKIGELQAEYLVKRAPRGNYVVLGGAQIDHCAILIMEGQMKVLKPYIDRGEIKVVEKQWTKDWNPYEARKIVENALEVNQNNIQAILAPNDGTAGGAIQALTEKRLAGLVVVSGQDAELAGCQRIVEGTQSMTVYVPIKAEAEANAEAAIKLARGEKFIGNMKTDNGRAKVPTLLLPPVSVDNENIAETVIKDSFQEYQEVYKNVPKNKRPVAK